MTKINKIFSINPDLLLELGKINASELVNRLLTEHFAGTLPDNPEILLQKIAENRVKKQFYLDKIRDINKKLTQINTNKEVKKMELMTFDEKEARKKEVEEIKRKWKEGEITDEEYWSNF